MTRQPLYRHRHAPGGASRIAVVGLIAAVALSIAIDGAAADPIPPGDNELTADLGHTRMTVFTHRPKCEEPSLLLVFHGLGRNAEGYRNRARRLGDRMCAIVVTPLFDTKRFPSWRYQRGGVVEGRTVKPPSEWTGRFAIDLVNWVQKQEARSIPYSLIGHSAGGQFLSRLAAFVPTAARRIVIANPSTYVFPSLDIDAPYGLRGVYRGAEAEAALRRYLAAPVTIYLGQEDTGDENRADNRQARAQGETRYDRGRNAFAAGQKAAQARRVPFNWRLIELPGAGHSSRDMFTAPEALKALEP
jgi:pimeloyl-ACP methyl ester carboxylesterase